MTDNELFIAIRSEVLSQLSGTLLDDVKVKNGYQPTQQAVRDRVVFIHKATNPQVGAGIRYNGDTRVQEYFKRASFQFNALAQQDPSDITSLTASDILTTVADLLQSYDAIRNLRSNGVNIERVTDVRQSYFINDKDRNESSPSFDLTVNYNKTYEKQTPVVDGTIENTEGV